jgi:hypothetical protein
VYIGPVEPAYPEVCCNEFQSEAVCEASPDNTVGEVGDVADLVTCQGLCQVEM